MGTLGEMAAVQVKHETMINLVDVLCTEANLMT